MTIKIEQDALLQVVQWPRSEAIRPPQHQHDCIVEFSKPIGRPLSFDEETEESSIFTSSTTSSDSEEITRTVSFAEDLITEEWTRPYTSIEDIPDLFYSAEQVSRFRQEYRLERKVLNELALDEEILPTADTELSKMISSSQFRHSISRVVVLHNDKLETFCQPEPAAAPVPTTDFFDNDSFWTGSITWY